MKKKIILRTGLQVALLFLAMIYGLAVRQFELPPYSFLKDTYNSFVSKKYNEIPKKYLETDVATLISIEQPQDVYRLRSELSNFLWGSPKSPLNFPATIDVDKSFMDERYDDFASLRNIEKIIVSMEFGLTSHVYHFMPKEPNNKVVLYHHGQHFYKHAIGGDFFPGKKQIKQFLDNGYAVVALTMPLTGLNNKPTVQVPGFGEIRLVNHDQMLFLDPADGHPIKYFIEPVLMVLNYLEKNHEYYSVSMLGFSGGGWTTTLVAALDSRVEKSFSVAGSYPIFLRSSNDFGGLIQDYPELYKTVNYLDLYILASYGAGRKHRQIINKYDPCCFSGIKWKTYKDIVRARVDQLGEGEYDLFLDESHREHKVSPLAMKQILRELDSNP